MSNIFQSFWDWLISIFKKSTPTTTPPVVVPPVVTPPITQPVTPPATGTGSKAVLFTDHNGTATSSLEYAIIHGTATENKKRTQMLEDIQASGSPWLVFIVDKFLPESNPVLRMCLAGMPSPVDGHYMSPPEGWMDQCAAKGINRVIAIYRDSPDSGVTISEASVKSMIAAFAGSKWLEIVFSTGLETKRNTSLAETVKIVNWFHANCTNRIVVGDQSADWLLSVLNAGATFEPWLEQAAPGGSPISVPLTSATKGAYLADLARLAAKVGAGKTWAGEFWLASKAERYSFTQELLALGYNVAGGARYIP